MTRIGTKARILQFQLYAGLKTLKGWWLSRPTNLLDRYARAMNWIRRNTLRGAGITLTDLQVVPYPEVTGYFIPSLLQWGERDLAIRYARWLISIQNANGSWSDSRGRAPYTFDSGQILKGLLALVDELPELKEPVLRGCDWVVGQIEPSGRVTTPDKSHWRLADGSVVDEKMHLYALEPIRRAGQKWGIERYCEAVDRALAFYLRDERLLRFDTLSHFHAYIVEALVDLGYRERAAEAMAEMAQRQLGGRTIPAYPHSKWTCTTGLFQYAVVWYKLGDVAQADKAFADACALQNASGGFYGSVGRGAAYFPHEEISWALKYFLDALALKVKSGMESILPILPERIAESDGRYRMIADAAAGTTPKRVLDAGCGKGRISRLVKQAHPEAEVFGLDFSEAILKHLPPEIRPVTGTILNIPFPDHHFDLAFCVEALEHAINVPAAIQELGRVVKPAGTLIIIDKNKQQLGSLAIPEWEQWFSEHEVTRMLQREGFTVSERRNIPYNESDGSDSLFIGWVAKKILSGPYHDRGPV